MAVAEEETQTQTPPEPDENDEPEQPETINDEPPDEPETPPTPPAEPMSEKEIERAMQKLEAETKRHTARVSEILGGDATELVQCELCNDLMQGFRWRTLPDGDARKTMIEALTGPEIPKQLEDPDAKACDVCNGHGKTLTGSLVYPNDTKPCPKCGSKGWTTEIERNAWDSTHAAREVAAQVPAYKPAVPSVPPFSPAVDSWGRSQGNPFFGRDPQWMTPEETAQDWQRAR